MNNSNIFRLIFRLTLGLTLLFGLSGCNGMIYNDQGDCDPYYKIRFRYDMNLKWADAFASEVNAVNLYIIDAESGKVVRQYSESGDELRSEGYLLPVDVKPGRYHLLAWCGEGLDTHFTIPESVDHHFDLGCSLNVDRDEQQAPHSSDQLKGLYHGYMTDIEFPDTEGEHIFILPLTKDTNDVNVVLQHTSGEPVDESKFHFSITSSNAELDYKNDLASDETVTYHHHYRHSGTAGIHQPGEDGRAINEYSACVAGLTTSRLVKDTDTRLNVHNTETGELVFSIPLIDYALLVKGKWSRPMTDQEYLDRQDKYDMVFFLDEGDRWMDTYIYINSWRVVLQKNDL